MSPEPKAGTDWRAEVETLGRIRKMLPEARFGTAGHDQLAALMTRALRPHSTHLAADPNADLLGDPEAIRAVAGDLGYACDYAPVNRFGEGILIVRDSDGGEIERTGITGDDDVFTAFWGIALRHLQERLRPLVEAQQKALIQRSQRLAAARRAGEAAVREHRSHPLYPIRNILRSLGLRVV